MDDVILNIEVTIDWIIPALQMTFLKLPQSMIVKDNVSTLISFYAVALLTGNFVDVAVNIVYTYKRKMEYLPKQFLERLSNYIIIIQLIYISIQNTNNTLHILSTIFFCVKLYLLMI